MEKWTFADNPRGKVQQKQRPKEATFYCETFGRFKFIVAPQEASRIRVARPPGPPSPGAKGRRDLCLLVREDFVCPTGPSTPQLEEQILMGVPRLARSLFSLKCLHLSALSACKDVLTKSLSQFQKISHFWSDFLAVEKIILTPDTIKLKGKSVFILFLTNIRVYKNNWTKVLIWIHLRNESNILSLNYFANVLIKKKSR